MDSEEISHYRIIEKLGAGGMGEVFLAEDIRLNRKVAIKMLPSRSLGNEQAKKRLFREARAAAALDHKNICAIHEIGEEGDTAFIVMQFVEGRTLSQSIRHSQLSPLEIVDIGIQTAEALVEAHSHGVIHRDIKPQNIIVTPRGQVKVLDFGLAKILEDEHSLNTRAATENRLTQSGEVLGTVGYMSPEQLKDLPIDARTDLFSLGVTFYECATGKAAFSGSSKMQICLQVIQFDPPRPSHLNPDIPFELDNIILKAIAKDVDARYQSAGDLLSDLSKLRVALQDGSAFNTQAMTPEPGSSRPARATGFTSKFPITNLRAKAGLILVPLLIIGVLLAVRLSQPSAHQPSPEAKRWYDRGTNAIREGSYYQASKALETAVDLDDKFALAHARLAEAYVEMDYTDKAMEGLIRATSLVRDRSTLPRVDGLYLDAIEATVGRNFSGAINYYGKIAAEAADSEKSSAYLDLGRSYEKNENTDKAIEYYEKAAQADSQSAVAFLRLAILYGRRQDLKSATEAFDKAESIYQAMSNQEGVAEVLYQRGTLFSKIRKLADARRQLEAASEISQNLDNKYQFVRTQLQLSGIYYAEGDTERAKDIATKAITLAQKSSIRNLATNGLIDLGYTLLSRGEFNEAGEYFKQALNFAGADKARRTEARAKLGLGNVLVQQSQPNEAISLLQEALDFYQPAGYRKEASIALTMLGRAHTQKGEYDIALKTFEQQLELARELDDPAQVVASHLSIAVLLGSEQERYAEALSHLDESYRINEKLNSKIGMGYDQMNRATLLWQLGRYQQAREALDVAFSIANRPEASYKAVLAWVQLTDSQMALSERRFAEAKSKGQLALDLAGTQYPDVALQAKQTIGLAQALSGAPLPAKRLCEAAVVTAKEVNSPRLLSSALLSLAEVLVLGNDAPNALATALKAQAMFAPAGQQDSEWRALLIAARASELVGNESAARDYASRADDLCLGLAQKWGAEAYDEYSRRPDIQNYRKQLAQILSRSK
ncbi:MAG TPA: protein kinase [Blastocatellia bacterium]|nr:protein kinase [Blastocatellia bacterium]